MRIGKIHIAVCVSALIHAALFGIVLFSAYNGSNDVPGDGDTGDTIAVSMISENVGVNSSGKSLEVKQSKPITASNQTLSSSMAAPSKSAGATTQTTGEASPASAANKTKATPGSSTGSGDPRLLRMWRKINRSKYYPLNARRNSLKGDPRVTFKIGNDGQIEYVRLAQSCGITLLDDAAIETIRRAVPLPYYPKPITLTIRYSMKD